jgi:hypothetical protein
MKKLVFPFIVACALGALSACSSDIDRVKSDRKVIDPEDVGLLTRLDKYIQKAFAQKYNVSIDYRYDDKLTDRRYRLAPVKEEKAVEFLNLIDFVFFDTYKEAAPEGYAQRHTVKYVNLFGSSGYSLDRRMAGAAPQGMIWMYNINELDTSVARIERVRELAEWNIDTEVGKRVEEEVKKQDEKAKADTGTGLTDAQKQALRERLTREYTAEEHETTKYNKRIKALITKQEYQMRESYISTLFHESAHTLHEERAYPPEFDKLSALDYQKQDAFSYWDRKGLKSLHAGFVSDYASTDADEDFAELFATYVLRTDEEWADLLQSANEKIRPDAKYTGKEIILQKLSIMKQYIRDEYSTDLDAIRQKALEKLFQIPYKDFTQYPTGY